MANVSETVAETVTVTVRFHMPGWHFWPHAPAHRAYLGSKHRHLFHVECTLAVAHHDREVEFHDLLDFCKGHWPAAPDLGPQSCETLAQRLAHDIMARYPSRAISVSVFEDGEVGATVNITPERIG
jgi:hypothetical protein